MLPFIGLFAVLVVMIILSMGNKGDDVKKLNPDELYGTSDDRNILELYGGINFDDKNGFKFFRESSLVKESDSDYSQNKEIPFYTQYDSSGNEIKSKWNFKSLKAKEGTILRIKSFMPGHGAFDYSTIYVRIYENIPDLEKFFEYYPSVSQSNEGVRFSGWGHWKLNFTLTVIPEKLLPLYLGYKYHNCISKYSGGIYETDEKGEFVYDDRGDKKCISDDTQFLNERKYGEGWCGTLDYAKEKCIWNGFVGDTNFDDISDHNLSKDDIGYESGKYQPGERWDSIKRCIDNGEHSIKQCVYNFSDPKYGKYPDKSYENVFIPKL